MHAKPTFEELVNRIKKLERGRIEDKRLAATFRSLFDNMQDIFYRTDKMDVITWVSRPAVEMLGYESIDQIIGRNVAEIFYESLEDREVFLKKLYQKVKVTDYEIKFRRHDGSTIIVSTNSHVYKDENGEIVGVEGICRDITKRKQAENFIHLQRDLLIALCGVKSLSEASQLLVDAATTLDGIDCGGLYLRDPVSGSFNLISHKGLSPAFVERVSCYEKGSAREHFLMQGKPLYLEYAEWEVSKSAIQQQEGLRGVAVIPISYHDQIIACMNGASHTLQSLPETTKNELEILASLAGSVIVRIQTEEDLRKAHDQLEMKVRERTAALAKAIEKFHVEIDERKQAEQALKESEEKFKNLTEESLVGVYLLQDGIVKYANPKLLEIFGYSVEDVVERKISDTFILPEDLPVVEENIRKRLSGETKAIRYEFRGMRKDKKIINIEAFGSRTIFQGRPAIIGALQDITERKKAETALRFSEEKFAKTFASSPNGILLVDLKEWRRVEVNEMYSRLTGYSREEVLDTTFEELQMFVNPEQYEICAQTLLQHGMLRDFETELKKKSGELRIVTLAADIIELRGNKYALITFEDITDFKRAEQELRKKEEQQTLILRSLPMAFYVAQPFGSYGGTWVSEQIENISGFAPGRFMAHIGLWADRLHPDDKKHALMAFEKIHQQGSVSVEYRWKVADGSYKWFHDEAVLIRDEQGGPKEIIGTWLDVTERKRTEKAIQESERKYKTLFESAGDAIFTVQLTGKTFRMVDCNTRALEMFGLSYEEMITKSPADLSPPVQPDGSSSEQKVGSTARRTRHHLIVKYL
jgi:PAS domain S-box-containing protein